MSASFSHIPVETERVETENRRIVSPLPVPESLEILEASERWEPKSIGGQPPIVWDHAEGVTVSDKWGNRWLDWSSGVLTANTGHAHPRVQQAIVDAAQKPLTFAYFFANEPRIRLAEKLGSLLPKPLDEVFLLTTGSETTENAIKLARVHGGDSRKVIVSFERAFHGRTLGAQQAGGFPDAKKWIGHLDPNFVQVPFPDGFRTRDTSFETFERSLSVQGIDPVSVAAVMMETYQGGGASFAPVEYMQQLRKWCDKYGALLILDEVQAGFGRCGTMWGFEAFGIVPDIACFGKGISSSLPLAAVAARSDLLAPFGPGSMSSTHGGHPIACAAALANLEVLEEEHVVENAARVGALLGNELEKISADYPDHIGALHGKGMVYGLHMVQPGGIEPDSETATRIVEACFRKGLLMFAPVGLAGATIKICPPLVMSEEQVLEGVGVLREAFADVLKPVEA